MRMVKHTNLLAVRIKETPNRALKRLLLRSTRLGPSSSRDTCTEVHWNAPTPCIR